MTLGPRGRKLPPPVRRAVLDRRHACSRGGRVRRRGGNRHRARKPGRSGRRLPRLLAGGAQLRDRRSAVPRRPSGGAQVHLPAVRGDGLPGSRHPPAAARCGGLLVHQSRVARRRHLSDEEHRRADAPWSDRGGAAARPRRGAVLGVPPRESQPRAGQRGDLRADPVGHRRAPARARRPRRRLLRGRDRPQDHPGVLRDLADPAGTASRRVGGSAPGDRLRGRAAPDARARDRRRRAGRVLPLVPRRIRAWAGVDGPEGPEPGRSGLPDDATSGNARALAVRLPPGIRAGHRADL